MSNLTVLINAEESLPAPIGIVLLANHFFLFMSHNKPFSALKFFFGTPPTSFSLISRAPVTPTRERYCLDEIELSETLRDFDFPIRALATSKNISKSLQGNEFSDVNFLGTGSNSLVYKAKRKDESVVIKMLKHKLPHHNVAEKEMNLEMLILTKVNHPNIIGIKGAGEIPRKFIVVDYLKGGTLDQLLKQRSQHHRKAAGLPVASALSIARDLASALKYLHDDMHPNATVIHRDLKPQNIGFTADRKLKLFDFGLVCCVQKRSSLDDAYAMSGFTGTVVYMAPEVALRQLYNEKVDVYSFGILFWQLLSGENPFAGMSHEQHMERVVRGGQRIKKYYSEI